MLYKYLPSKRVDVLENLKIRFSPLPSLNDPFEHLPLIEMGKAKEDLISEVIEGLDELWSNTDDIEKTEENRKLLEQTKIYLLHDIDEKTSAYAVGQELMSLLGDNFGVLSLSRTETSLLMWSHYAEAGKGIVLGFNDEHIFFRQKDMNGNSTRPIPVVYTTKRRRIVPGEERYYEKLLCEKPLEWAYEEEERVFGTFLSKEEAIGKDEYGQDVVLSGLPKETIRSVYLGYNVSKETEQRVYKAINRNEIGCNLYRSYLCQEEYRVKFELVKRP